MGTAFNGREPASRAYPTPTGAPERENQNALADWMRRFAGPTADSSKRPPAPAVARRRGEACWRADAQKAPRLTARSGKY